MVCPLKVLPFKEVLDVVRHLFMSWKVHQKAYKEHTNKQDREVGKTKSMLH